MDERTARRVLLVAVTAGLFVGLSVVLGWAKLTPAGEGFFTFCGVLIGAQVRHGRPPQ